MRPVLAFVLLFAVGAAAEDIVYIKNQDPVEGEIQAIDEEKVTLKTTIELAPGQFGARTVNIPTQFIESIEFEESEIEKQILERTAEVETTELASAWNSKRFLLHRPKSNAGKIGMAYANRLLDSGGQIGSQTAFEIFQLIENDDWNSENKLPARQGRLRALIALGKIDEVIDEAQEMAEDSKDPLLLIEAKFVLASVEFDKLKAIHDEHPKWMEDDEVKPIRNQHYHQTLDLFLFPYLFYGSEEAASARGLWMAKEVYHFVEDEQNAIRCAEDIVRLYPNSTFKSPAESFLNSRKETP